MSEQNGTLSPDQLRAIGGLSGANSADLDGLDSEAVFDWSRRDPRFVASLNRAKSYHRDVLRAEIQSLASEAVKTLRKLVRGADIAPAVRLRASLAILEAADALKPESIGSTSATGVRASMEHQALIESLGG
jgi:hypothetical protein